MPEPKILVAIPYHEKKRYAISRTLDAVKRMTYQNKEVLMRWDLGEYGGRDRVKFQRESFRNIVLSSKEFDYLFFMGVDTIPPPNVLDKLTEDTQNLEAKGIKNIVGGVYWGRNMAKNSVPNGAVAWIHEQTPAEQRRAFLGVPTRYSTTERVDVDGMGMDCVLLSREILGRISWLSWEQNDDDYPFYDKAKELGYRIFVDVSIQCRHYSSINEYTERGEVHKIGVACLTN